MSQDWKIRILAAAVVALAISQFLLAREYEQKFEELLKMELEMSEGQVRTAVVLRRVVEMIGRAD